MKRAKNIMAWVALPAIVIFALVVGFGETLISATSLDSKTALNRIERYQRPSGQSVYVDDSDTVLTVTGTYASNTVSVTVAGNSIQAYINGVADSTYFTKVAFASKTIKQVCDLIDGYTYYACAAFPGGDYYLTATDKLAASSTVDVTSGGQLAITVSPLKSTVKVGMAVVLDNLGGNLAYYLTSIDPRIDSITNGYVAVYEGNTIIWQRRVEDWAAADALLTAPHFVFPGPGLVTDPNSVVGVRLWAGDTIQGEAEISATAHSYGY